MPERRDSDDDPPATAAAIHGPPIRIAAIWIAEVRLKRGPSSASGRSSSSGSLERLRGDRHGSEERQLLGRGLERFEDRDVQENAGEED